MCPDGELLSVYLDGELDPIWSAQIAGHLEICPACHQRWEELKAVQVRLQREAPVPGEEILSRSYEAVLRRYDVTARPPLWKRRVAIPLPLAAAAAAVMAAVLTLFAFQRTTGEAAPLAEIEPAGQYDSAILTAEEAALIMAGENAVEIYIRLPESRQFSVSGEPQLLRAAEYQRRP